MNSKGRQRSKHTAEDPPIQLFDDFHPHQFAVSDTLSTSFLNVRIKKRITKTGFARMVAAILYLTVNIQHFNTCSNISALIKATKENL